MDLPGTKNLFFFKCPVSQVAAMLICRLSGCRYRATSTTITRSFCCPRYRRVQSITSDREKRMSRRTLLHSRRSERLFLQPFGRMPSRSEAKKGLLRPRRPRASGNSSERLNISSFATFQITRARLHLFL